MDALVLAFISGLAIALTVVLGRTLAQRRELERLRELAGVGVGSDALEPRIRDMLDQTAASDWQSSQAAAEMRYLGDPIGVGVVRLDDAGPIDLPNAAAHEFLGLAPHAPGVVVPAVVAPNVLGPGVATPADATRGVAAKAS